MLQQPYQLRSQTLRNRIVMAPMTRTRADDDRVPTDLMREYYEQRASAGLIVTECTAVREDSAGIIHAPGIYSEAQVEGWRKVTQAVHAAGGKIYLQLWHCGRISHPDQQPGGELPVAPSAITAKGQLYTANGRIDFPTPRALELSEIPPLIEAFGRGASNARSAGFDGVELHGAFGYLPEQFLKDGTNIRTDAYGGSVENRARFMLEVVESMIGSWDAEHVGVKLSPSATFYGQSDSDALGTYSYVANALNGLDIGYIHVMEPNPDDLKTGMVLEHPTQDLRQVFRGTVITNGGYDKEKGEAALQSGTADLVSYAAKFIANPDLPPRFAEDAPLNEGDYATYYGSGPKGYTDYPTLDS
ncbi:alkene reductase [Phyllobacterium sp. SB3]|uniref:alkene reductase n=1 Tax=Phyllobacterium sp. SB3 TaxID=3156073 RepID=UPI0032AFD980